MEFNKKNIIRSLYGISDIDVYKIVFVIYNIIFFF